MIMVSEITGYNYTAQARPSWENADNFSVLMNQNNAPSSGLLRKLAEMLKSAR